MPEYLAPGVYVEETSFRAKSIEGVSTSTTGFVGPTRRGPVAPASETDAPQLLELVTSFGDFQRIYGGFEDLSYGPNYLAHAVRSYFDNGGSRLYVARVAGAGAAAAVSGDLGGVAGLRFEARSPGLAGNGKITIFPHFSDATKRSMDRAPQGTTLRIGAKAAATSARLAGNARGPFTLPRTGKLTVTLNTGAAADIDLNGQPAEVSAATAANLTFDADKRTLTVTVDNVKQQVTMPATATREQAAAIINAALVGGYARVDAGQLFIGSDVQGSASKIQVESSGAGAVLGFAATANDDGAGDLPNVRRATVQDLASRLSTATGGELIASADGDGNLVLTTRSTGAAARILLSAGTGTVHGLLGFADGATASGSNGSTDPIAFYVKSGNSWLDDAGTPLSLAGIGDGQSPSANGAEFVTVGIVAEDGGGISKTYDDLGIAPAHPRFVGTVLAKDPSRRADQLENVFAFVQPGTAPTIAQLRAALFGTGAATVIGLSNGSDGSAPQQIHYEAGLRQLAQVEDISIVAAPGESAYADHQGIQGALISHCERRRAYRIAVLDAKPGILGSEVRAEKARIDSTYAALYYPWVVVSNPLARPGDESIPREIALPPSGFVSGIYARNDVQRGVFKAPANEVVQGALRYDVEVNFAQQEVLNPLGINCLRFFPGRGNRVWGARTTSSDPEWKYVNVRRYFAYLERSIDVGTQWSVFEPNGERLWANIRDTISSFLTSEWRSGALLGESAREAFFVRCDRSTMDQNDLDNGRLVCLVGVAVVKPAEFVIFRVGQKTADARS